MEIKFEAIYNEDLLEHEFYIDGVRVSETQFRDQFAEQINRLQMIQEQQSRLRMINPN